VPAPELPPLAPPAEGRPPRPLEPVDALDPPLEGVPPLDPPPLAPPELDEAPPPEEEEDEPDDPEEPDDPDDPDDPDEPEDPEELGIEDELLDCCWPPAQPPMRKVDTAATAAVCAAAIRNRFNGSRVRIADTPEQELRGADAGSPTLRRRR
jgi:hypothetical protein